MKSVSDRKAWLHLVDERWKSNTSVSLVFEGIDVDFFNGRSTQQHFASISIGPLGTTVDMDDVQQSMRVGVTLEHVMLTSVGGGVAEGGRDLLVLNGDNVKTHHCLDVNVKMYSHVGSGHGSAGSAVDGKDTNVDVVLSQLKVTSTPLVKDLLSILPGDNDQPHLSPLLNPYVKEVEEVEDEVVEILAQRIPSRRHVRPAAASKRF